MYDLAHELLFFFRPQRLKLGQQFCGSRAHSIDDSAPRAPCKPSLSPEESCSRFFLNPASHRSTLLTLTAGPVSLGYTSREETLQKRIVHIVPIALSVPGDSHRPCRRAGTNAAKAPFPRAAAIRFGLRENEHR